jgi:hypothetical protein
MASMGVEAIPAKMTWGTGEEGSAIWLKQQDSAQASRQKSGLALNIVGANPYAIFRVVTDFWL